MFKRFLGGLLIIAPVFSYAQAIDYSTKLRNQPMLSDASYLSLATAQAAAGSTRALAITKNWTGLNSQTSSAPLYFTSGKLTPGANQTITIAKPISAPLSQIFDTSQSGAAISFSQGAVTVVYPQWWGAKGDNSHDDTVAIQAAIDSCRGTLSGARYTATCSVVIPTGTYLLSNTINMFASHGTYMGMSVSGISKYATQLTWAGDSNISVIKMVGHDQRLSDMYIYANTSSGWLDAIQYDGDISVPGISTGGKIENVWVDCNGKSGNGISAGRGNYQADQLDIDHPYIANCSNGAAVNILDANALSVNLISPNINHSWKALFAINTPNAIVFGGELDDNDINFHLSAGTHFSVYGTRTEGSKRQYFSSVARIVQSALFSDFWVSTNNTVRPATTANCTSGNANIVLSVAGYTLGDTILLPGCGVASADLTAQITSMTDTTHAGLNATPSTSQTAVSLSLTGQQYAFIEAGGGPYVHIGGTINTVSGGMVSLNPLGATQTFHGVGWAEDITNPFNIASTTNCPLPSVASPSWTGLESNIYSGAAFTNIPDYVPGNGAVTYVVKATNASSNNNLTTISTNWCSPTHADGQRYTVYTGIYTLQAGSNTLNIQDGTGPHFLKSHNGGGNITTPYAAGSLVPIMWSDDVNAFVDLSQ